MVHLGVVDAGQLDRDRHGKLRLGLRQVSVDESFRSAELIDDDRAHGIFEVIGGTI